MGKMLRIVAVIAVAVWSTAALGQFNVARFKALMEPIGAHCVGQGPGVDCKITRKALDGSEQDLSAAYTTLGEPIQTIIFRVTPFGQHKQPDSAKVYEAISSFLGDALKEYPTLSSFADECVKRQQVRQCNTLIAAGKVQVQVTINTTGPLSNLSAVMVWQE
jgi:hypothetical protein